MNRKTLLSTLLAVSFVTALPVIAPAAPSPTPGGIPQADGIEWRVNFDATLALARSTGKPILLSFGADWCPYSRRMKRETFVNSEVVRLSREFLCVQIDGETAVGSALMERYGADAYPYTLLLDSDGSARVRLRGLQSAADLAAKMQEVAPARIAWYTDLEAAFAESRRTGKPLLVYFHANWCPYSRRMERETFANRDVARLARSFICVKIDTGSEAGKRLVEEYAVDAFPYLVFFSRPGNIVKTAEGLQSARELLALMRSVR